MSPHLVLSTAESRSLLQTGFTTIVGRSAQDPVAPGPSAIRLTHAGRVCIGLSPAF